MKKISNEFTSLSKFKRASRGTRTPDQLITNQLLYQLSYAGTDIIICDYLDKDKIENYFNKETPDYLSNITNIDNSIVNRQLL